MRQIVAFILMGILVMSGYVLPSLRAEEPEIAGTFFGNQVSKGNYYFVMRIVLLFNTPWGGIPNNHEQLEQRIWDDLLLSYEAHRRGIIVSEGELNAKIDETLKGYKVSFSREDDPEAYDKWTSELLGEPVEMFENQIRHLVQVEKLRQQILESIHPEATDAEAYQEFLNEQNSLSVELARFDDEGEAKLFYENIQKNPALWIERSQEDADQPREERVFRRPGFVTLEFLMGMWKFPYEAVYSMMDMDVGGFYPPVPVYRGYGVFKILDIRKADESVFQPKKQYYIDQIHTQRKYKGFRTWLENYRKRSEIQIYLESPYEIFS